MEVKYAAMALDLDGTLLDSKKRASDRNIEALLDCHRNGCKIIFATARPPRTVKQLLPPALLKIGSFVYYNGALVSCKSTGIDVHIPIERELSRELLDYCLLLKPDIEISYEVLDEWYSLTTIDSSVIARRHGNPTVKTEKELKELQPTKILMTKFLDGTPILNRFSGRLNMVVTDNGTLLQVMSLGASKEKGVKLLCDRLGIDCSALIAFGDDYNDIGMLKMSGYSVAMGNATEEVKQVSDEIAASHDDEGVALVLERLRNEAR